MLVPKPKTKEEFNAYVEQVIENSVWESHNLLDIPKAPIGIELQAKQLEKCNRLAEAKRRCLENHAAREGTSGTRNKDEELLGTTTKTLRGQSDIVVKDRR